MEKNVKIFDLEQEIMDCWGVVNDIDLVTKHFIDDPAWEGMDPKVADALMNKYFAIKELYEVKFEHMWYTFEEVAKEYQQCRKLCGTDREEQLEKMFEE
jgi:hypothetical protein